MIMSETPAWSREVFIMPPYTILFVVHDDFLQGDDCARLFGSSSVHLTVGHG